ncbi:hypothetical protein [Alkalimonas amylolytica]|uniref:Uncharacterized protein n=1 Tax=Alkalimonas amylolytica TaxID=152573 RepID=A0A1H4A390_ALKAM|nr:hypothetical protein [Alkalimonas amylolytica]SEA29954.1 hypothetical protein SAMN04488051_102460 [Alkalimonas amylolytica]
MINFNLTSSKNYIGVQSQLNKLIQQHLPAGSYTETTLEYVEGALNFTMFVRQQADVLMSHGAADKNYHWKKYLDKSFVNEQTRRKHLFVPGNLLVDRISQSRKLPSFNRTNVHSVGWPRLDALIALQNEYDKDKPAARKKMFSGHQRMITTAKV